MKGIPPEIDRLMWAIAEEANPNAEAEFLRRYPLYREELVRRRSAVSGLRTGRPKPAVPSKTIPRFVPREVPRPAAQPRLVVAVGLLVLLSIAVASYTVTTMLSPFPTATTPSYHSVPPTSDEGAVAQNRIEPSGGPVSPGHTYIAPGPALPNPGEADRGQSDPPAPERPAYDKPQSLVIKRAGLVDVLRLLGAETGIKVVMAPGMPNPTIAVEYHDMTAMEMLRDLGERYRFTPFDQGDGSVVVYPVVEDGAGVGTLRKLGG